MQFLKGNPRKQWFRYIDTGKSTSFSLKDRQRRRAEKKTWYIYEYLKKFLLDLIQHSENRLLTAAQSYNNAK